MCQAETMLGHSCLGSGLLSAVTRSRAAGYYKHLPPEFEFRGYLPQNGSCVVESKTVVGLLRATNLDAQNAVIE